jgi:hypothetical protein
MDVKYNVTLDKVENELKFFHPTNLLESMISLLSLGISIYLIIPAVKFFNEWKFVALFLICLWIFTFVLMNKLIQSLAYRKHNNKIYEKYGINKKQYKDFKK